MKTFKRADYYLQLLVIATFIIALLIKKDSFVAGYMVVSILQLLSVTVHYLNGWLQNPVRRAYQYIVYSLLLLILVALIQPALLIVLFFGLYVVPVLQLFYCAWCYYETTHYLRRPLDQLK